MIALIFTMSNIFTSYILIQKSSVLSQFYFWNKLSLNWPI